MTPLTSVLLRLTAMLPTPQPPVPVSARPWMHLPIAMVQGKRARTDPVPVTTPDGDLGIAESGSWPARGSAVDVEGRVGVAVGADVPGVPRPCLSWSPQPCHRPRPKMAGRYWEVLRVTPLFNWIEVPAWYLNTAGSIVTAPLQVTVPMTK